MRTRSSTGRRMIFDSASARRARSPRRARRRPARRQPAGPGRRRRSRRGSRGHRRSPATGPPGGRIRRAGPSPASPGPLSRSASTARRRSIGEAESARAWRRAHVCWAMRARRKSSSSISSTSLGRGDAARGCARRSRGCARRRRSGRWADSAPAARPRRRGRLSTSAISMSRSSVFGSSAARSLDTAKMNGASASTETLSPSRSSSTARRLATGSDPSVTMPRGAPRSATSRRDISARSDGDRVDASGALGGVERRHRRSPARARASDAAPGTLAGPLAWAAEIASSTRAR